jgi:hypothetical protein
VVQRFRRADVDLHEVPGRRDRRTDPGEQQATGTGWTRRERDPRGSYRLPVIFLLGAPILGLTLLHMTGSLLVVMAAVIGLFVLLATADHFERTPRASDARRRPTGEPGVVVEAWARDLARTRGLRARTVTVGTERTVPAIIGAWSRALVSSTAPRSGRAVSSTSRPSRVALGRSSSSAQLVASRRSAASVTGPTAALGRTST